MSNGAVASRRPASRAHPRTRPCAAPSCHSRASASMRRGRAPILLDESHVRRAARQRFEPERAAAREQVEHARSIDARLQPVEQGFPHPIRRRTDLDAGGKSQAPAAMAAADDAQDSRPAIAPRVHHRLRHRRARCAIFSAVFCFRPMLAPARRGLPPFGAQAYATAPIRQVRRIVLHGEGMRPD